MSLKSVRAMLKAMLQKQLHRIGTGLGLGRLQEQVADMQGQVTEMQGQVTESKMLMLRVLIGLMKTERIGRSIHDAEFKVFSQFGDDGIIQYLIHHVGIPEDQQIFVEFGVENYEEANTRFLLTNNNWRGLIMDASADNILHVRTRPYYWRYDLTAVSAFITRENINDLLVTHGFSGKLGLLSIDLDGNDYWVWKHIQAIDPILVVVEFNSVFGMQHAVTIPYDPDFNRTQAHYSNLYWGCSLRALCLLAEQKGYIFVGCNSGGNNAFFVRKDKVGPLKGLSVEEGYVESRFRESRARSGELNHLSGDGRLREIANLSIYHIEQDRITTIAELFKCT
jgi:hypothetical protein